MTIDQTLNVQSGKVKSPPTFPVAPSDKFNQLSKEWMQLISHLTNSEKIEIGQKIDRHTSDQDLDIFLKNLKGPTPFRGPFWETRGKSDLWCLTAFKACEMGKISVDQYITVELLAAGVSEFSDNRIINYHEEEADGSFTPNVVTIKPLSPEKPSFRVFYPNDPDYDKKLNLFFKDPFRNVGTDAALKEIKELPLCDQVLFELILPRTPITQWSTLLDSMQKTIPGFFQIFEDNTDQFVRFVDKRIMIVPSFPLLRIYFRYLMPDIHLSLSPMLGTITSEDIAQTKLEITQPIGFLKPGSEIFLMVDGNVAGKLTFIIHDLYHAYRSLYFHWSFYVLLNRMTKLLRTVPLAEKSGPNFTAVFSALTDAEFRSSRPPQNMKFGEIFYQKRIVHTFEGEGAKYKEMIFEDIARYKDFWESFLNEDSENDQLRKKDRLKIKRLRNRIQPEKLPFTEIKELLNLSAEDESLYERLPMNELLSFAHKLHLEKRG